MPELPEVETVMRGLKARLEGQVIAHAALHRETLRWPVPRGFAARLTGARVLSFRRRAKYILMRLSGGDSVMLHLGMSGRMVITPGGAVLGLPAQDVPGVHEHLVLRMEDGARVGFVDPRRFGSLDLMRTADEAAHARLRGLGPEPLDAAFTPAVLGKALAARRTPIKTALLDQTGQPAQLHEPDRRLDVGHPVVEGGLQVGLEHRLRAGVPVGGGDVHAVFAQAAQPGGPVRVVQRDHAAFAGGQHLARVEGPGGDFGAGTGRLQATGYDRPPTPLAEAIRDYVQGYLLLDRRLGDERADPTDPSTRTSSANALHAVAPGTGAA